MHCTYNDKFYGDNMKDLDVIRSLIGSDVPEDNLTHMEYYVNNKLGLFIPDIEVCNHTLYKNYDFPSYMIVIYFDNEDNKIKTNVELKKRHYLAEITSPNVTNSKVSIDDVCYYLIMINQTYFEQQYKMYEESVPKFCRTQFSICTDILKTMNTFAFEYSKGMKNSQITLDAQSTIITHWIIRSILGETLDVRSISSNYTVGRVQQYVERHYGENITVERLAKLCFISESTLNRLFKQELGLTPFEYLIETRVTKAKIMLMRKDVSITDISLRCGFNSNSHFATCFKSIIGISPSEYRKKLISEK